MAGLPVSGTPRMQTSRPIAQRSPPARKGAHRFARATLRVRAGAASPTPGPRAALAACALAAAVCLLTGAVQGSDSAAGAPIRTQWAHFHASGFAEMPGWPLDDFTAVWDPLLRSCSRLAHRDTWASLCARAQTTARRPEAIQRFFEEAFLALQIRSPDGQALGGLTAYYEPSVLGARAPSSSFPVAVYGTPRDLLVLDASALAGVESGASVSLRRLRNELVADRSPAAAAYRVDPEILRELADGAIDRRLRLRLDGNRLVPYFSRGEIQRRGLLDAPVLAWLADPLQLYAMQVQGAGRVRFADGASLRLAFGEQNGHPFKPVRLVERKPADGGRRRGGPGDARDEEFDFAEAATDPAPAAAPGRRRGPGLDPDAPREDEQRRALRIARLESDPSYVFFREVSTPALEGPPGALGVSLTPERSVAVDPRVTPLGYPLFISAADGANVALRRLVMAQDTGGAVRGLHADLFVGSGHEAGLRAWGTGLRAEMWLLVPRDELPRLMAGVAPAGAGRVRGRTRECLIDDPLYCASGLIALPDGDAAADQSALPTR